MSRSTAQLTAIIESVPTAIVMLNHHGYNESLERSNIELQRFAYIASHDLQTPMRSIVGIMRRLHDQQEYPGTGIGLAVCRCIVHRHGGKVWVESEPGKGSIFYFSIASIREA